MVAHVSGWFYDLMSRRLIAALEDMGVTELIVGRRRHAFLQNESVRSISSMLGGENDVIYHFGSMTEGTTTPEMGSDIDILYSIDKVNIMSGWPEWERGRENLLMVKHETCSSQHYRLLEARDDLPIPLTQPNHEFCVTDVDGKIYRINMVVEAAARFVFAFETLPFIHAGPSFSFSDMVDCVHAFRCKILPVECESWFSRPRHRNWPTPEMIRVARELGCFLVPDGHFDSEYSFMEWRVSPSLIERHLMFNMNIIHIQCYVKLKLLKKDIINPYLNKKGKITSFHCKTMLLYAREQLEPSMWTVDNLFHCIIHCLKLLRGWAKKGHCPYYIMETVNLFDGKLNREQRGNLQKILTIIIDNHLAPLAFVTTDALGVRLLHNVYTVAIWDMTPRRSVYQGITGFLSVVCSLEQMSRVRLYGAENHAPDELCLYICSLIGQLSVQNVHRFNNEDTLRRLDDANSDILTRNLTQHLASTAASICLQQGIPIGRRI